MFLEILNTKKQDSDGPFEKLSPFSSPVYTFDRKLLDPCYNGYNVKLLGFESLVDISFLERVSPLSTVNLIIHLKSIKANRIASWKIKTFN